MVPSVSLLIATYNWKEALRLSLLSAFTQTSLPKEIIIADDGSREDTRQLIEEMRENSSVPIIHVWHEDQGFRLSEIRNKAIACATGDYIIQIDGDIIMNRFFIADHLELAEENRFVCGSRILLPPEESELLIEGKKDYRKIIHFALNGMRCRFLRHYLADRYMKNNIMRLRGCNMAFWRKDLIAVNGYNESFASWGHEDSELAYRLIFSGVRKRFLKMGGVAFHLYHKMASRSGEPEQMTILRQNLINKESWVANGLDKHLRF